MGKIKNAYPLVYKPNWLPLVIPNNEQKEIGFKYFILRILKYILLEVLR